MDLAALERFIVTAKSRTQGRFLGGHSASIDGWEYHDSHTGGVAHFEGREHIAVPGGDEVCALLYHGGLVRPD